MWRGRLLVCALALGACGGEEDATATATLGAEGGTLTGEGELAGVRVEVAPGALDAPTAFAIRPATDLRPLPRGAVAVGPVVRIDADAEAPVRVTLPFSPAAVRAAGGYVASVKVWRVAPEGWTLTAPAAVAGDTVTLELRAPVIAGAGLE